MVGAWGPVMVEGPTESLCREWSKSLVFQHIINIYDVILWRHLCYLNCNSVGAGRFLGVWRIFAQILVNVPEKIIHKKKWPPKKALHVILSVIFAQIFRNFMNVFGDFTQISSDFAQIFTKSKLLEVHLYPMHLHVLHQCSTVTKLYDATWYLTRLSDLWNCCQTSR